MMGLMGLSNCEDLVILANLFDSFSHNTSVWQMDRRMGKAAMAIQCCSISHLNKLESSKNHKLQEPLLMYSLIPHF